MLYIHMRQSSVLTNKWATSHNLSLEAQYTLGQGKATTKPDTCIQKRCLPWYDLRPILKQHSTHLCHSSQLCSSDNVTAQIDDENSYIHAWPIENHPVLEYSFGQSFLQGWGVHTNKPLSTIDDPLTPGAHYYISFARVIAACKSP